MSFDIGTILNTLILLSTAFLAWYTVRATKKKLIAEAEHQDMDAAETVTDAALKLLKPLNARIEALETEIKKLTAKIEEMQKLEEYLQGEIHARDTQIKTLVRERAKNLSKIDLLKSRVEHLEMVCKRAGINGEEGTASP